MEEARDTRKVRSRHHNEEGEKKARRRGEAGMQNEKLNSDEVETMNKQVVAPLA